MKESEAVNIAKELDALFPRDALTSDEAAAFVTQIALLREEPLGRAAAQLCVERCDRFPTIAEFRRYYREANERGRGMPSGLGAHAVRDRGCSSCGGTGWVIEGREASPCSSCREAADILANLPGARRNGRVLCTHTDCTKRSDCIYEPVAEGSR